MGNMRIFAAEIQRVQQACRHLSIFQALARLTNIQVKYKDTLHQAVVTLPGLSPDDFDRTGNLPIWRVLHWTTMARMTAYNLPDQKGQTFLEYDHMTNDMYTFFASSATSVSKELYKNIFETEKGWQPIDIRLHLGYIGTTSLNTVASVVDRNSGVLWAQNTNQVALVNKQTRSSAPIPDWWKLKYLNSVVGNKSLIVKPMDVPTNITTAQYDMKVRSNDTDIYHHTNYLSYVLFCFDAAADANAAGKYSAFSGDILHYKVKSIRSTYRNESVANDELNIISWENPHNPLNLNFSIQKENIIVFQSSVEFYEPDS